MKGLSDQNLNGWKALEQGCIWLVRPLDELVVIICLSLTSLTSTIEKCVQAVSHHTIQCCPTILPQNALHCHLQEC